MLGDMLELGTHAAALHQRCGELVSLLPDALLVARTLNARDFVVDYRTGVGIRVSPHFYNTEAEIDELISELARILRTRDYDAGAARPTIVT